MKTILILVLSAALVASAYFTRPTQADFKEYADKTLFPPSGSVLAQLGRDAKLQSFLNDCHFKDRYLWVEVEKDGKLAYTGAFSHWFDRTGAAGK